MQAEIHVFPRVPGNPVLGPRVLARLKLDAGSDEKPVDPLFPTGHNRVRAGNGRRHAVADMPGRPDSATVSSGPPGLGNSVIVRSAHSCRLP